MAYVTSSDNFRIYYDVHNHTSSKPVLVFLHGIMADSASLSGVVRFFSKHGFPVVSLDLRGHGKSSAFVNRDFYRLDHFVADVESVVDAAFPKRDFYLIGYSFGGMIALRFAELFPSRVKRLVIMNSFYKSPIGIVGGTKGFRNLVLFVEEFLSNHPVAERLFHKFVGGIDYRDFNRLSDISLLAKTIANAHGKIMVYCIDTINRFDLSNFIRTINIPTLIIAASHDQLFPVNIVERMHRRIKHSSFVVFEGTHTMPYKKSEAVAESILGFLSFEAQRKKR